MVNNHNHQGSRWWKFDFHTHTPASDDYGRGDESIKQDTSEETWLRHAMQAKLDCVAITDHNSGAWIDKLKTKYSELSALPSEERPDWFRELVLFPGVEITVADSSSRVHLLAIFDPSEQGSRIIGILALCGIHEGYGDDKYTSTDTSFIKTVENIKKQSGIAIPAHIDREQGLLVNISKSIKNLEKVLITDQTIESLFSTEKIDGIKSLLDIGNITLNPELRNSLDCISAAELCSLQRLESAQPELQDALRKLAPLAGSDAHKPENIGRRFTWLKMGRPSIDGLRLALMDHEFCVKNQTEDPNHTPDIFLTQLSITRMEHCGRIPGKPFVLPLHTGFNAIIGGRGTGKSTVLESVRIVTRRENELEEAPKLKGELDKFMKLASNKGVMLNDTEILLGIHRRGRQYRLRWRYDGQGTVLEEETSKDNWQPSEQGDIKERFPLSIYSQSQINELSSNPKGLLEIVDRSPEVNRQEWQKTWNSTKSQFMQLRERRREIDRQLAQEPQIRAKLQDVNNDLKRYEEKGHGGILKNYQKRSQQLTAIPLEDNFDGLSQKILDLSEQAGVTDFPAQLFETDDPLLTDAQQIHGETAQALRQIQEELQAIAGKVNGIIAERTRKLEASQWLKSVREAVYDYETLSREYEEKNSHLDLNLYGRWVQQRGQLQQELDRMEDLRKESEAIRKQLFSVYTALLDLRSELLNRRNSFIASVIGNNPYVRMELIPFGDVSSTEADYRSLLGLDGGNFRSAILDQDNKQGLLWKYSHWEESKAYPSELPKLIENIKKDTEKEATKGNPQGRTFADRIQRVAQGQPANIDQLWCWWPEDLLRVKYSRDQKSDKFDDLEKGSAGQKAAAILAFLLSHGTEPLIIDQPENDLDNALISDLIVTQIHANKTRRQLVIVTHNPNIVVNGDAELVHLFKFEKGQVQIADSGGLVDAGIRDGICTIMEGGREAFDKRYKRITLEI